MDMVGLYSHRAQPRTLSNRVPTGRTIGLSTVVTSAGPSTLSTGPSHAELTRLLNELSSARPTRLSTLESSMLPTGAPSPQSQPVHHASISPTDMSISYDFIIKRAYNVAELKKIVDLFAAFNI